MIVFLASLGSGAALAGQVFTSLASRDGLATWQHALWNDAFACFGFLAVIMGIMSVSTNDHMSTLQDVSAAPSKKLSPEEAMRLGRVDELEDEDDEEDPVLRPPAEIVGASTAAE